MGKIIALGADHAGVDYKVRLIEFLQKHGYNCINIGTDNYDSVDYPIFAKAVCDKIINGSADFGILICGTGIGMSMVANRYTHIRAAVCTDIKSAELTRQHNNANILCLGARIISYEEAQDITQTFLSNDFMGGKHEKRIRMFD